MWLLFALLANLLYSVANIMDQVLRRKHIVNDSSFILAIMPVYFFIWLAIIPFIEITVPPIPQLAAAVLSGFIVMFMVQIYVYAISREEISSIMPMFQFSSVFVLVFSAFFLGEALDYPSYFGFVLMFISGVLISVEKVKKSFTVNRTLLYVVGASFILAASTLLIKFFYITGEFWNGFFWYYLGCFLWTAFFALLPGKFRSAREQISKLRPGIVSIFVLSVIAGLLADLAYLYAVQHGPVSLVSVVGSTQLAMLFVMTMFLTFYFPKILKERTDRKTLLIKGAAIALMVAGLLLIGGSE